MSTEMKAPITYPPGEDAAAVADEGGITNNEIAIAFIFLFVLFKQSTIKINIHFVRIYI